MRIDPNQAARQFAESSRTTSPSLTNSGAGATASSSALGEDQAQLSGVYVQVQALTGQALQFPEIRQEKVNALRQVVQNGSYQPGAQQVGDAVFAHMLALPAA